MITEEWYHDQLLNELRSEVRKHGTQVQLAKKIGVSVQHINDILHEKKNVTGKTLDFLGFYKMTIYKRSR